MLASGVIHSMYLGKKEQEKDLSLATVEIEG